MQEFLSVIRSSTLFSGISEQELTAMLACLGTKASRFPKDALLLLRAGDTAESIGLVLSGSVLVEQEDVWGNRNILSKAGPGQTFAAAYACAPGSVLKVSVAAETPATVLFLNVKRVLTMCPSACASIYNILDPEVLALGGGLSAAGPFLFDPLQDKVSKKCFYSTRGKLVPAVLGNEAGMIGAALLARDAEA